MAWPAAPRPAGTSAAVTAVDVSRVVQLGASLLRGRPPVCSMCPPLRGETAPPYSPMKACPRGSALLWGPPGRHQRAPRSSSPARVTRSTSGAATASMCCPTTPTPGKGVARYLDLVEAFDAISADLERVSGDDVLAVAQARQAA